MFINYNKNHICDSGTSVGTPYLGGQITVQTGTYYTTFSVTVTDPAVKK